MLQSLVRMCNITMLWHIGLEEFFRFLDFPNAQAGGLVDLLLKKNRHGYDLRFKIANFRFIIAKILKLLFCCAVKISIPQAVTEKCSITRRVLKSATQRKFNSSNKAWLTKKLCICVFFFLFLKETEIKFFIE